MPNEAWCLVFLLIAHAVRTPWAFSNHDHDVSGRPGVTRLAWSKTHGDVQRGVGSLVAAEAADNHYVDRRHEQHRHLGIGLMSREAYEELRPHDRHGRDVDDSPQEEDEDHNKAASAASPPADAEIEAAKPIAIGMVGAAVLGPIVVRMANSKRTGDVTMRMLDIFVAIFVAVLWFNFLVSVLDYLGTFHVFWGARLTVATVTLIAIYLISMILAYLWRDHTVGLVITCSFAPHCIAFAGINVGTRAQRKAENLVPDWDQAAITMLAGVLLFGLLAGISAAIRVCLDEKRHDEALSHRLDHMELDAFGMVTTYMLTQAVCAFIVGHNAEMDLLQVSVVNHPSHEHHRDHHDKDAVQMALLAAWAGGMLALALVTLPRMEHWIGKDGYWQPLVLHTVKVMMVMMVAWGFLLGAEWVFFFVLSDASHLFAQLLFAIVANVCVLIILRALLLFDVTLPSAMETRNICITGASLVAAWSWEECFNEALDTLGQVYQVGYGGLVPKAVAALVLPCVMMPTYIRDLKPRIEQNGAAMPQSP